MDRGEGGGEGEETGWGEASLADIIGEKAAYRKTRAALPGDWEDVRSSLDQESGISSEM